MPVLEVVDVQLQLSRAFDIAGGFVTSVSPNVSPTIQVGPGAPAPFSSDYRWTRADTITGDATHPGVVALINPSTDTTWLVVDSLVITAQAGQVQNFQGAIYYGQNAGTKVETVFAPGTPLVDTDTRQRAYSASPLTSRNQIAIIATATIVGQANSIVFGTYRGVGDTPFAVDICPVILVPNTALLIGGLTNTQAWFYSMRGRIFELRQK